MGFFPGFIGGSISNQIGSWEPIDEYLATGSVASVTFSSSGDGSQLHDIDGDVDHLYRCDYYIIPAAPSLEFFLRPNGLTTDQSRETTYTNDGSTAGVQGGNLSIAGWSSGSEVYDGTFTFRGRTGRGVRRFKNSATVHEDISTTYDAETGLESSGGWNDDSTPLTSLVIIGTGNMAAGTWFFLERKRIPW